MDAAAKTVESLSRHILPERPHHLSYSPHWRFRPPPDGAAHGGGGGSRFEEWHNTRLQYMTLVSNADRGTLLTRSYYDMREEPPKPVPREVSALAKAGGDKKKKLSLTDYKNKKTGAASSASPPEPAIAKKKESERAASASASAAAAPDAAPATTTPNNGGPKPTPDSSRPTPEVRKPAGPKPQGPQSSSSVDSKQRRPRDSVVDTKLPPKPPSLPPKPPSPAVRKRLADIDDEPRPQKRPRPDDRRPVDDKPTSNRDDAQKRKDRSQQNPRDAPSHRDNRPAPPSSLPNGRSILKGVIGSNRNPSPGTRPRGDSVNGVRQNPAASNRTTPTKLDASKTSVPPLLSPLHLSFDDRERNRCADDDSNPKKERKKRDDSGDVGTLSKTKKLDSASGTKKSKPLLEIPPLLSPTLPPAVEAELLRRKKASPESVEDKSKDDRDALGIKKRPSADNDDEEPNRLNHRRRLIVVLSIPKGLRQAVKRILALPTVRKDAQGHERERGRAASEEATQPTQARKRPANSADAPAESVAAKRPRTSDVPSLSRMAATPSTPSKKSTAMSRVSSSNSLAQTPGEAVNATPTAPVATDRRPNGQDAPGNRPDRPEIRTLAEKEERRNRKGKSLKHDADLTMRNHRSPNATSMKGKPGESKVKLGYVISVESIIAFVMGFQAQNLGRNMMNRRPNHNGWASMFPLLEFLQNEIARDELGNWRPLHALFLLLHAVCVDELLKCYASFDNLPTYVTFDGLIRLERKKARLWPMIREAAGSIESPALRVDVGFLYTVDDITDSALRILRKWCSEEKVDWTPEPMLREFWPIKAGHTCKSTD
ncbi:hypothetical protein TOPH_01092 [Tolypocladium ophioglossoides CBS 100239]|uniref:Uncharacterized protein n=1 Tax=Tolypocladium ophioglossoides (strain CBS 100239) TaxID=1163406 RepID=A0A0L0NJG8_TOLOC|nr:hypothetical protein TOPH_01092 [Tolypocladium ophioglossoides CBS 100239]